MTPADLALAVDTIARAVSAAPVLVDVDGHERELDYVEARTDGRLVLHVKGEDR
jgi:hypothetical protein